MNKQRPPRQVIYQSIGQLHQYSEVWEFQTHLQQKLIKAKRAGSTGSPGYLLLCEHNPVYTLGKSGKVEHLLLSSDELEGRAFEFFKINRGGDITYHGPGQITGYPILDLDQYYNDLHRYVREIEEVVIQTIAEWGIAGGRVDGFTGVWLGVEESENDPNSTQGLRKICAIGVHMSRWVSMHGFALNVNTDLNHFRNIVPCGIDDAAMTVTTMAQELGREIELEAVQEVLCAKMEVVFGMEII